MHSRIGTRQAIWEIDPTTSLDLGAGAGIGAQPPALRVFFAVQRDVKLF